jgi:uncharacterized protein YkuJ
MKPIISILTEYDEDEEEFEIVIPEDEDEATEMFDLMIDLVAEEMGIGSGVKKENEDA